MRVRDFVMSSSRRVVAPLPGYVGLRLSRTSAKHNLHKVDLQFRTVEAYVRRFKPDLALPLLDLTVEAEALGASVNFKEKGAPNVVKPIVKSRTDLEKIDDRAVEKIGRMPVFTKVARLMAENLPRDVKVGSFVTGPFTLAGQLMGTTNLFMAVIRRQELVKNTVKLSSQVIAKYIKSLSNARIDFLVLAEPTGGLVPEKVFRNFIKPFLTRLIQGSRIPVIIHSCGRISHLLSGFIETGALGMSVGNSVDIYDAALKWKKMIWVGNYPPLNLLTQRRDEIVTNVKAILKKIDGIRNFVLSTGCDIPYSTPIENIETFIKEGKKQHF